MSVPPEQLPQELLEFYDTRPLGGISPDLREYLDLRANLQEITELSLDPVDDCSEFSETVEDQPEVMIMGDDGLLDEIEAVQEMVNEVFAAVRARLGSTTNQTPAPRTLDPVISHITQSSEQRFERMRRVLEHLHKTNKITTFTIIGAYAFGSRTPWGDFGKKSSGMLRSRFDWNDRWRIVRAPATPAISESLDKKERHGIEERIRSHGFHLDSQGAVWKSEITSLEELYHDLGD